MVSEFVIKEYKGFSTPINYKLVQIAPDNILDNGIKLVTIVDREKLATSKTWFVRN